MQHKNYLDHVYAVTDDSGNLLELYRYTAFGVVETYTPTGQQLAASAIDNPVRWNSRRYDEATQLHYYKYRHYSPKLGRWLGRDPIEEDGGINLYAFVGNQSLNWTDILGLQKCQTTTVGIRIKDYNVSPRGAGFFGIEGRSSIAFRGSRAKCCKICSDGSEKSVYTYTGTLSFDTKLEVSAGPQINATVKGWGLKGRIGLVGVMDGRFEASGGWTWDQCEQTLSLNVAGSMLLEGKVGGGFKGGLYAGRFGRLEATGFFGGYARIRLGTSISCNTESCVTVAEQNSGEVGISGEATARVFGKNFSARHNFGRRSLGSRKLFEHAFIPPRAMKP